MLARDKTRRPKGACQYEGCDRGAWAQGYCDTHYQRMRREGVLQPVRKGIGDPVARFHASYVVDPATGCWNWTGWIHPKGYGILVVGGKSKKYRGHRLSYQMFKGPVPAGTLVCHTCDNRCCVNPDHLFLGDHLANARDMVSKGRHAAQIGATGPRLTRPMALNIRIMYARGRHSMQKLADIYDVDHSSIVRIVKGRGHLFVG